MVHDPVQPLLALALQGLEKAKRLFVVRLTAHIVALLCAILAAVCSHMIHYHGTESNTEGLESLELVAAIAAVVFEGIALYVHHCAMELHSRGREAMRRVMLLDALHPSDATRALEKARHHFDAGVQRRAAAVEERDRHLEPEKRRLRNYYLSDKEVGQARLRDHLYESAIFSHHLYAAAWKISAAALVVLLGLGAIVLCFLLLGTHELLGHGNARDSFPSLAVHALIALVAFVPACQELEHLLLYQLAQQQLGDLLRRLEDLYGDPLAGAAPNLQLFADLTDYAAATTFAPPIRTIVFWLLADRLDNETQEKIRKLSGTPPAPP